MFPPCVWGGGWQLPAPKRGEMDQKRKRWDWWLTGYVTWAVCSALGMFAWVLYAMYAGIVVICTYRELPCQSLTFWEFMRVMVGQ